TDRDVHQITDAPEPLSRDMARRTHRYLVQMGIRTVCFILAVVTTGPPRWIFFIAAVVLPYFAVLLANAGQERSPGEPELFTPRQLPRAEPPPGSMPPNRRATGQAGPRG